MKKNEKIDSEFKAATAANVTSHNYAADNIIFGPVLSRRLGYSLGIDLLPHKTCSLNCVYCECGATSNLTINRKIFIPTDFVIKKLEAFLKINTTKIDFITFSGSGEPTLALNIGEIINYLKKQYPQYKIAVLTNGTLLSDINVRQALENSNLVVPTLNSLNKESFRKINRPHQELSLDKILTGLTQFKKEFKHEIWLEVFIIPGINDNAKELAALKDAFKKIQPDKIQLNSLARPGTESWVSAPNKAKFKKIADFFQPYTVEIVNKVSYQKIKNQENKPTDLRLLSERILATLQRRPSRKQDLVSGLNVSEDLLLTVLKKLIAKTKIIEIENQNEIFYKANF